MKKSFQKVLILCFLATLCSCAPFYTRHYTKGFFHEALAHKSRPVPCVVKSPLPAAVPQASDSCGKEQIRISHHASYYIQKEPVKQCASAVRIARAERETTKSFLVRHAAPAPKLLKKSLHTVTKKFSAARHSDSVIGEALLYILALVLALGIVALAIWFLPSILIPSAVSSTFISAVLIAAAVVLVLFALLIYKLIQMLIDLFKHRKTQEEDF